MDMHAYNLAFTFPGQGSQSVGMLDKLAAEYPKVKQIFTRASDALGKDLWTIVSQDPNKELDQTHNTQPIMLAAGIAVWEIWRELGGQQPTWLAGHSLGEYTGLVCCDALSFEDAIRLVAIRGELMQDAVPEGLGAMAAILGMSDHQVVKLCAENAGDEIVAAANFNSEGQVVIAGHATAVHRAIAAAKAEGAKRALLLPVSVPSHCELMRPAAEKLADYLASTELNSPQATLIHNIDVASHNSPEVIRDVLKKQLYLPVRWVDTIRFMHDQGVTRFVECGPGKVLLGLNKRIVKTEHYAIYDPDTLHNLLELQHD